MPKLTKRQFEEMFREDVLPYVIEQYEQDGIPDKPARREAWNNTIDAYIRDRMLPEAAGNWAHPRWLETWRKALARNEDHHHATKKSRAQLDREIAEALAARSGLSKHHRDLLARRGPGGGLRAGYLTPAGWHGDPMAIEDRRQRLEALREQPAPKFPTTHATKRSTPRSAWPSVVGSHDLGTADVRTEQGAYWIVTKPTGYRVDYKPWGPSSEVDLGMFPSRKHAREKIAEHALSVGATVSHATKKTSRRGAPKFEKFDERSGDDWFPLWKFREMIVDGRIFDEDGTGKYGKLAEGQKVVSNVKVDLSRFATSQSFDRNVPPWATSVVWSSARRPKTAHATRGRGAEKEVTYRGYTYNLRSAYDRGYYDALRGARPQEQGADYATGYASGQRAPHTRR